MKCPECQSKTIEKDESRAELICKTCGLVLEDQIADLKEFRDGVSITSPVSINGKIFKAQWGISSIEKRVNLARSQLELAESRLQLPGYIISHSLEIYRKAIHNELCIGRDSHNVILACLYASCIINNIPKTAIEITSYTGVSQREMLKEFSRLKQRLDLRIQYYDPVDLIPRFISRLKLNNECLNKAIEIIEKMKGTKAYAGKNPRSVIAAAIYLAAKVNEQKISQREIANELGVMEVTIRKRYKELTRKEEVMV